MHEIGLWTPGSAEVTLLEFYGRKNSPESACDLTGEGKILLGYARTDKKKHKDTQAYVLYCTGAKTEGPRPEFSKMIKNPRRKPHELHEDTVGTNIINKGNNTFIL
jgi:hypothetical protein